MTARTEVPVIHPIKRKKEKQINTISPVSNTILHVIFVLYSMACIVPMLIIIGTSFTQEDQILKFGYRIIPTIFSTEAYSYLLKASNLVGTAYRNTIIATLAGTALCVVTVALYAYPLSRRDFRMKGFFTFYLFFTMLFSGGLVPYYVVAKNVMKLYDTIYALFIPLSFSAYWVIVMKSFYRSQIPDEIIESSRIDGAGEWRTLVQIVLPLALPGLATVALFAMIGIWNNFFQCMLLTSDQKYINLQYMIYQALSSLRSLRDTLATMGGTSDLLAVLAKMPNESFRMAMCVVTVGPIIFTYPFFQKYFVKGLTIGALKG